MAASAAPLDSGDVGADRVLCAIALCVGGARRAWLERIVSPGACLDTVIAALAADGLIEIPSEQGAVIGIACDTARENVCASMHELLRRELHLAIAEAIAETALDPSLAARALAFHLAEAGEVVRAVDHYLLSAELHEAAGETVEALVDYRAAAAAEPVAARRIELLERLALAANNADSVEAADCWSDLACELEAVGDVNGQARALYHLYWACRAADAPRWLHAAAALGDDVHGWSARAAALLDILGTRYADAIEHDRIALRLARSGGDRQLEALALLGISVAYALLGDMDEAIAAQRQSIAICSSRRDHRGAVTGRLNLVQMLTEHLCTTEALDAARSLVAYVDEHRLGKWRPEARVHEATVLAHMGRLAEARTITGEAFAALDLDGGDVSNAYVALMHARVMVETGLVSDLEDALRVACASARAHGVDALVQESRLVAARHAASCGDIDRAVELVQQLDITDPPFRALVAALLARIAIWHDRPDVLELARATAQDVQRGSARVVACHLREVEACIHAAERGSIARLEQVARLWSDAGRELDAIRVTVSIATIHERQGRQRDAAACLIDAERRLLAGGSLADLDFVAARLERCAGTDAGSSGVSASELFVGLDARQQAEIDRLASTSRYEQGRVIYAPDDAPGTIYFLREGQVRLYCMTDSGKRLTVAMLDAGDVFGESALLGQSRAGLYAEAVEPVVVGVLAAERVRELITRVPAIGLNLLALVGERLHRSHELTEQVAFWTVDRRIVRLLLDLDERYGHPTLTGERVINKAFTQFDIAEMVNARRETVGEFLKSLRERNLISMRGRRIVVASPDGLRALLG